MRFFRRQPKPISCQEFVELVTDYLEGALPEADRKRFEAHMEPCHWCSRYLEQMRVTLRTVGRIPPESLSGEARETLLGAFRNWNAGGPLPHAPGE